MTDMMEPLHVRMQRAVDKSFLLPLGTEIGVAQTEQWAEEVENLLRRATRAEADNARLRHALEWYAAHPDTFDFGNAAMVALSSTVNSEQSA